jgi:hypothetical protein
LKNEKVLLTAPADVAKQIHLYLMLRYSRRSE